MTWRQFWARRSAHYSVITFGGGFRRRRPTRVEQAARAIEAQRITLEQLERNAGALFGHEEYIRDEMYRVGHLGRFLGVESMLAVITNYLEANHPDVRLWEEEDRAGDLWTASDRVTESRPPRRRGVGPGAGPTEVLTANSLTFQGEVAFHRPDVELLNVVHPLVRAAVAVVRARLEAPSARVAQLVLNLPPGQDDELSAGIYFLTVFTHTVEGLRARLILEPIAWSVPDQIILESEAAERLLHLVIELGLEWDKIIRPLLFNGRCGVRSTPPLGLGIASYESGRSRAQALRIRRIAALQAEFKLDRHVKETRLRTATARGHVRVLPALRGQLQKADAEYRATLAELERNDQAGAGLSEPIAACAAKVSRDSGRTSCTRRMSNEVVEQVYPMDERPLT